MKVELLVGLQIVADIALLVAILFLVWAVNRERKKNPPGVDAKTFAEFKQLIEESRSSSEELFRALHEMRELAAVLDAKERRLMARAHEPDTVEERRKSKNPGREEKYENAVEMARHGATAKEIADVLNVTEGEIALILDLHRKENENPPNHVGIL